MDLDTQRSVFLCRRFGCQRFRCGRNAACPDSEACPSRPYEYRLTMLYFYPDGSELISHDYRS